MATIYVTSGAFEGGLGVSAELGASSCLARYVGVEGAVGGGDSE